MDVIVSFENSNNAMKNFMSSEFYISLEGLNPPESVYLLVNNKKTNVKLTKSNDRYYFNIDNKLQMTADNETLAKLYLEKGTNQLEVIIDKNGIDEIANNKYFIYCW
jgi:hypothetical protein